MWKSLMMIYPARIIILLMFIEIAFYTGKLTCPSHTIYHQQIVKTLWCKLREASQNIISKEFSQICD
ncbi:hypothetical protein VNO77_36334 [Canavalia gladiata]|uniref:Uncharacterized protein n=1 Tax=Canavalia gladiata TaxID=3824 RepID=A0AAN9KB04_CANGL